MVGVVMSSWLTYRNIVTFSEDVVVLSTHFFSRDPRLDTLTYLPLCTRTTFFVFIGSDEWRTVNPHPPMHTASFTLPMIAREKGWCQPSWERALT